MLANITNDAHHTIYYTYMWTLVHEAESQLADHSYSQHLKYAEEIIRSLLDTPFELYQPLRQITNKSSYILIQIQGNSTKMYLSD